MKRIISAALALCMILVMLPVAVHAEETTVSSFAELKEAVEQHTSGTSVIYSGSDEPLVIEEDFVLPRNVRAALSAPVVVPAGVTLTVEEWLDTAYLTVEGTLHMGEGAYLGVYNGLTVTGSVFLSSLLQLGSDTTVTGLENITMGANAYIRCRYDIAGSFGDLVAVMDQIAEKRERYPDWQFEVVHYIGADDLELTSDLVIPEGVSVFFATGGGKTVVPEGVTVTAYGSLIVSEHVTIDGTLINKGWTTVGKLTVNGTLCNDGYLNMYYHGAEIDSGITISDGAVYEGQGTIRLENGSGDAGADLLSLISGLNLDNFEVLREEYMCTLMPVHEHVFENGWCRICGKTQEELPGATSGVCGDNLTWQLDENGTLTISGTGPMYDYGVYWDEQGSQHERQTEWNRFDIKAVVIEPGVTTVGNSAFAGAINMTQLQLSEGITSIGESAFMSAPITTLKLPDSVTSIGMGAFYNCTALAGELTLPAGLEQLGGTAFSLCTGITGWKIADGNKHFKAQDGVIYSADMTRLVNYPANRPGAEFTVPDSVDTIGVMAITGAQNLQTLTLGKGVKTIGQNAINGIQNLKAIEVSDANPNYVSIDGVLFNKAKTQLVSYPAQRQAGGTYHVPEGVQQIGYLAFYQSELKEIVLPDSVTEIGMQAMYGCPRLKRIDLGEGLQKIGYGAFADCTALNNLVYPATLQTIDQYHLLSCEKLTNVTFKGSAPAIVEDAFYGVGAIVAYPAGDATWNDIAGLSYGGELSWIPASPILEGADGVVNPATGESPAIRVDAPVEKLVNVTVNGKTVAPENYTVTEGSTVVTFKPEYLATLRTGYYTVVLNFTDTIAVAALTVPAAIPGDADGNGVVDLDDAIYLLFHILIGDGYPVGQACDYDGSGELNLDDAIHLLFHVLVGGEDYELNTGNANAEDITLKIWAPGLDQETDESWLPVMLSEFEEAHPEYNITWDLGICNEGNVANMIQKDPAAAADVYFYANDLLGILIEAGALAKLEGSYLESVRADFAQTHVDLLTYTDGSVYGFPAAPNTWFMWYNKSVFSEEDIKNLNTMLEKGVVSFPMDNSWYTGSFLLGAGGTVFGPQGNDAAAGIDFSTEQCVEAAGFMVDLVAHPNFVNDIEGSGVRGMQEGTVHAMFSGDWDAWGLASLGDNLGCAMLPRFTVNGTDYQMKSFASGKAVGVNPNASNREAAMQLARFLTTAEAQSLRYELSGYIPAASGAEVNSEVADTVIEQMEHATVVQPVIPEMIRYWDPVRRFGAGILEGSITRDNVTEMLAVTMAELNG